jgi:DnaJ-class molecular chaperone
LLEVERTADDKAQVCVPQAGDEIPPGPNPGARTEAKFKQINEAYACLSDPQKRAAYDRYGHAAFQQGGPGGGGLAAAISATSAISSKPSSAAPSAAAGRQQAGAAPTAL